MVWIARGTILANLAGDGRFCVGPIMLILASAVVILGHGHGSFKAGKFTVKENRITNFNNGRLPVVANKFTISTNQTFRYIIDLKIANKAQKIEYLKTMKNYLVFTKIFNFLG